MNNEINGDSINNKNEKSIKESSPLIFKINILKPLENEIKDENPNDNNNKKNRLFLSPSPRRKSKNNNNLKLLLKNSFKSKNGKSEKEYNEKENSNLLKTKSIKESQNNDKSQIINSENISKINSNSPKSKHRQSLKTFNSINNNNYNDSDIINLFHFANNLYQKDEHLSKNIISKKLDMNDSKNKSNILLNVGRISSLKEG